MSIYEVKQGTSPVIIASPHGGTQVADDIWVRLNDCGKILCDTDWHINRLYDGLLEGATRVQAKFHRYVIDANRDPQGVSLYPGQNTTTLIPLIDFKKQPIWQEGKEPTQVDIQDRIARFHKPYHDALANEIARVKAEYGVAIVYDCHSIERCLPFLFEGQLPDFNVGTNDGRTCAPEVEKKVADIVSQADGYSYVINGRFKGGWTTRYYGRPQDNIHAIQMELVRDNYLVKDAPPFHYDEVKTERLRSYLQQILHTLETLAPILKQGKQ